MTDQPLPTRIIFEGRKIDLALATVELADGARAEREVVLHRGAVALLVEPDPDHLILVRNQRYAVGQTLIEVPAGTIDPGETPEQTAAREVEEETGHRAGRIEPLRSWWVSPGILSERMHLFRCTELTPTQTAHQPDEQLVPIVVSWHEALAMASDGRIDDAKTLLSLWIGAQVRSK
ncbi:MAG: ADP-ribose pyrophosphatase [Isosphaeraceae bacterium]|jgi:ADP-ribose pyrophosphatase|nr:MAG: ADP-ribose pyrophosphatase [Isosphaeraceae bacterium]